MAVKVLIKKAITRMIPASIKDLIIKNAKQPDSDPGSAYLNISYAQEGEDMILNRIFEQQQEGFYIDIGAHHPHRFSNTYSFYRRGWRGINIDPIPNSKLQFDLLRPNDINLEIGISNNEGNLKYFSFFEKALNTFSEERARQYQDANWPLETVINVDTFPLSNILEKYLALDRVIDFMSIDVEGLELQVLLSNNWDLFKPKIILIEMLDVPFEKVITGDIYKFLLKNGYVYIAKTINTVFFKLADQ